MIRLLQPDLGGEPDSPFARDANNKLVRRGYWLDMNDRSLVMVMTQGIGAHDHEATPGTVMHEPLLST